MKTGNSIFELKNIYIPDDLNGIINKAPSAVFASGIEDLEELVCGGGSSMTVSYKLPDGSTVDEVDVVRVKNGFSANYRDPYMRRRDPECMVIADERRSDKTRYSDRFSQPFEELRQETFQWLSQQDIAVFAFEMGREGIAGDALAVCPLNAGFFAFGLGLLQGVVNISKLNRDFRPSMIIYVAPPFRHTHFNGKQVVVHNRSSVHEIFSFNLYPGPSAKKGVYGAMIELGEQEGWVTAHCSAVQVVTPYDNIVTFMHEGASGGGKSEMLQPPHRASDGRLLLGENTVTGEKRYIEIPRTCDLQPVCDDMGICHPDLQEDKGKLYLEDAENAWFVRVDHIKEYGTDSDLEKLTIHPDKPLLFLNIENVVGGTSLIWNHIEDSPGVRCPNPRVVIPRNMVPNVIKGKVKIDIRSFGVRTPPCSKDAPSYGIIGLLHILPPALAWLWRLVSPRGYANPSIVGDEKMSSEGVGSYWPFSTGTKVAQANLLLKQFQEHVLTRYILVPNQHVGVWKTGFMPQWLVRDYLARRGHAGFNSNQITPSRCSLLGYSLQSMRIEGIMIPKWFLQVDLQPETGQEAFDRGTKILTEFFHRQIKQYLKPELDPAGKAIIECCLDNGSVDDYNRLLKESNT